jgi:hypothetical protein
MEDDFGEETACDALTALMASSMEVELAVEALAWCVMLGREAARAR